MYKSLVGLDGVKEKVEEICGQANAYRHGVKPGHFIINLDAGNGQTTTTEYIAFAFLEHGIRTFGGLDPYLEFQLDGTMEQLKHMFRAIRSHCVYTNEFEGVIAMDISALANNVHNAKAQVTLFLKEISRIGEYASLIFYVPFVATRNVVVLIDEIKKALSDDVEIFLADAYTAKDLLTIVKLELDESGVVLHDCVQMDDIILKLMDACAVTNARGTKRVVQLLIKAADYTGFVPELTEKHARMAYDRFRVKKEGKR